MRPFLFDSFAGRELAVSSFGLARRFGKRIALAGLDLAVPEGATYILTGPNAAGKSTALRSIMGLVRPQRGSAKVFGLDLAAHGARIRTRIGYVPETTSFPYAWMTVARLLSHQAVYFPSWDEAYAQRLLDELVVPRDACYGTLSKGFARRVQLVLALAHKPSLLLLDEPMDGLDPLARDRVLGLIVDHLASVPTTLVLATHVLTEVGGLGDSLGLIHLRWGNRKEAGGLLDRGHHLMEDDLEILYALWDLNQNGWMSYEEPYVHARELVRLAPQVISHRAALAQSALTSGRYVECFEPSRSLLGSLETDTSTRTILIVVLAAGYVCVGRELEARVDLDAFHSLIFSGDTRQAERAPTGLCSFLEENEVLSSGWRERLLLLLHRVCETAPTESS